MTGQQYYNMISRLPNMSFRYVNVGKKTAEVVRDELLKDIEAYRAESSYDFSDETEILNQPVALIENLHGQLCELVRSLVAEDISYLDPNNTALTNKVDTFFKSALQGILAPL